MEIKYYAEVVYKINNKQYSQNFYGIEPGVTKKSDIVGIIKMNHSHDKISILSNKLRILF